MHIQETWSTPLTKCHIWAGHFLKWLISHVNEHFHMRNLPFQMWMQFPFLTFEFPHVETKHDTWKHIKIIRGVKVKVILIGYFHMKSNFNMPKENNVSCEWTSPHSKFTFSNVNYIHSYVIAFEHVRSNFNMPKNVMWTRHFLMWLIFYIIYIHMWLAFFPHVWIRISTCGNNKSNPEQRWTWDLVLVESSSKHLMV